MLKIFNRVLVLTLVWFLLYFNQAQAKENKFEHCLKSKYRIALLDTLQKAMNKPIEDEYKYHDFIQTFGCAYEEDDIEQNSIRAVYRAVVQSVRNRKVTFRDNLETILLSKPPRPDNLVRDYSVYVNIPTTGEPKSARYEVKILDLQAVPTIESSKSVWTRIVTRYAYKEDFNIAPKADLILSEFVNVMQKTAFIFQAVEKKDFGAIKTSLQLKSVAITYPKQISELVFGDSFDFFDETDPDKIYQGVYLGKGIFICETPRDGTVLSKLGEERLYRLRVDNESFRRTVAVYSDLNYQAPESVLQCLFVKYLPRKPRELPMVMEAAR